MITQFEIWNRCSARGFGFKKDSGMFSKILAATLSVTVIVALAGLCFVPSGLASDRMAPPVSALTVQTSTCVDSSSGEVSGEECFSCRERRKAATTHRNLEFFEWHTQGQNHRFLLSTIPSSFATGIRSSRVEKNEKNNAGNEQEIPNLIFHQPF
ncbi:MAG: hypothetical protein NC930_02905 [Candidatus Omnitrophica bacterium]|nr:hypothetical protein [Candidatus Omnitrophota bacterium]